MSPEVACEEFSRIFYVKFGNFKFEHEDKVITSASLTTVLKLGKKNFYGSINPFHRICVGKQSDGDLQMFFIFEEFSLSLFSEERMRIETKSSLFSAFVPKKFILYKDKITLH
ncbi:hypothetical protein AVEN_216821-1 [Araneus ventricosus]|uniref:Uncharacterized protein n=1 Tax=Araneus ventricosus TaxID=182803 RepID=A0A4Y2JI96_ARAVE|nr:hypothetical protein AVEN_216821-1 [Araneus ventricosus]